MYWSTEVRSLYDIQSILYLILFPTLIVIQWNLEQVNLVLYGLLCILPLGITAINHNIGHVPIWKSPMLNRCTEYVAGTLQGVPLFLFKTIHVDSHHRYNQGEKDATRVSRVGEHNHILGYLAYPLFTLGPVRKLRKEYFRTISFRSAEFRKIILQHVLLFILWSLSLYISWKKAFLFVFVPQLIGIHFLMASNYLQHAQCEQGSAHNHSRNFTGWVFNLLFFNVGYHTAHHLDQKIHWTKLPNAHQEIQSQVDTRFCKRNFIGYFVLDLSVFPFLQILGFFSAKEVKNFD
ncbi:MAG: fatty acid desaturase [Deltaproteobacteria bacterium]|nr:fatty acid desaturase [Deltaproteobacteria bacterium]